MEQNKYLVWFGKNIKRLRTEAGMTQEQLSENIGVTAQYLSYMENGSRSPSFELISAIADSLTVEPSELFLNNHKADLNKHKDTMNKLGQLTKTLSKDDLDRIVKIVSHCSQLNKDRKSAKS